MNDNASIWAIDPINIMMAGDISKIYDSFKVVSTNPVRYAGQGNFMETLKDYFADAKERMTPVEGMPGVYTLNPPPPQSLDSLNISML